MGAFLLFMMGLENKTHYSNKFESFFFKYMRKKKRERGGYNSLSCCPITILFFLLFSPSC